MQAVHWRTADLTICPLSSMIALPRPTRLAVRPRPLRALLAGALLLSSAACGDDDPTSSTPTQNILQTATATASLSTLNAAITAAGLGSTFTGTTKYTVFAPVNDAFAALPAGTVDALLTTANRPILEALLTNHVVAGELRAANLRDGQTLTTLAGKTLRVSVSGGQVRVEGALVQTADVAASNGVVHLIGGVITSGLDVVQRASITPTLSTLVTAVGAAQIGAALQAPGPITVFAPVNSAFAALPTDQINFLLAPANRALLTKVLTYHVAAGRVLASQLTEGQTIPSLEGTPLTITLAGGAKVNGVPITTTDIITANGVVHLISGVLTQNLDIVDVAALRGFSSLVGAVQTAGLTTTLRTTNNITVFAPTNAAFAAIPGGAPASAQALGQVLQLHVSPARLLAANLSNNQSVHTLLGPALRVNIAGSAVSLTGPANTANVTATDIVAKNGIIHVLNSVLLPPPSQNILQTATATPTLSTLTAAITAAGLASTFTGNASYTVFAPVNSAFGALPAGTVDALLQSGNLSTLQALLTNHVVAGELRASALQDGQTLTTLGGKSLSVRVQNGQVRIDGVLVQTADVLASNGVVHLIGGVLTGGLDVVQRAAVTPDLSTLVTAVGAANLVPALKAPGPITVFAPANSAFAALGPDQIARLLEPANRALLTKVLTYHVVPGRVLSSQLTEGQVVNSLEGTALRISLVGGASVNGRRVVTPDIITANGVVHIIDGVLTESLDIVDVATLRGFSSLVGAVQAAGLTNTLRTTNNITVFAPTNAAFAGIPGGAPSSPQVLAQVLQLHVTPSRVLAANLSNGQNVPTLLGPTLRVNIAGNAVSLTGPTNTANVTATDIVAKNGIIHVISAVLLPSP
jgi:transforming growth factor-beta-induced protein